MSSNKDSVIDIVSEVTQFNDLSEFMQDKDLDKALEFVVKLILKPDVPAAKAPELIIQLQALSAKFAILARYYTTLEKGTESAKRKNVYYTASDSIDKLVDAIKYMAKFGV